MAEPVRNALTRYALRVNDSGQLVETPVNPGDPGYDNLAQTQAEVDQYQKEMNPPKKDSRRGAKEEDEKESDQKKADEPKQSESKK